jgi:hypothetical protein
LIKIRTNEKPLHRHSNSLYNIGIDLVIDFNLNGKENEKTYN